MFNTAQVAVAALPPVNGQNLAMDSNGHTQQYSYHSHSSGFI
jgi:hypothetical protein